MRVRQSLPALIGAAALVLGMSTAASSAPASSAPAAKKPCGYYATASDSYYNHCTGDRSRVVIEVEVSGRNYEQCVGPGVTWLGSTGKVSGAWYVGRTC